MNALIGYSGFVGGLLLKQANFDLLYRSTNIKEIRGKCLDIVVSAGAPAQKWMANQDPVGDLQKINDLVSHIKTIKCKLFILISTVDVFKIPVGVDEKTLVDEVDLHAYGLHRRLLEKFVQGHFPNHLIVRLPGLVGPGLRKNVIFDFLNSNNLDLIESRSVFQFYPMVNLWADIQIALNAGLRLVHLTAEPISVAKVSEDGFGAIFKNHLTNTLVNYDMRTCHSKIFGSSGVYQYSQRETIQAVRSYAQSELISVKSGL